MPQNNEISDIVNSGQNRKKLFILFSAFISATLILFVLLLVRRNPPSKPVIPPINITGAMPSVTREPLLKSVLPTRFLEKSVSQTNSGYKSGEILATVGDETIYNNSVLTYPVFDIKRADTKRIIANKLIKDSIIIQEAIKDGMITPDKSYFNTEKIDFTKRQKTVTQVKDLINAKAGRLKGYVISLWFNNGGIGPLGETESKRIAKEKIDSLQNRVKLGIISPQSVVEIIKNDTSLAQIDKNYVENAYFEFDSMKGEQISFDRNFDQVLWNLNPGEVSDIYLLKDMSNENLLQEAVYVFGGVSSKIEGPESFEKWLNERLNKYEIYYQ